MAGRWRLADGLSLTHLENGGWTVADVGGLSVYGLDEDKGALIHHALKDPPPPSPGLQAAVEAGLLVGPAADPAPGPEHDGENDENT